MKIGRVWIRLPVKPRPLCRVTKGVDSWSWVEDYKLNRRMKMGYYTHYELSTSNNNYGLDHEAGINDFVGYQGLFEEEMKWYSHKEDMKNYSKKFPETLFNLSGEGEECGDLWREYYRNGKVQECKAVITYPEFNEDLMI